MVKHTQTIRRQGKLNFLEEESAVDVMRVILIISYCHTQILFLTNQICIKSTRFRSKLNL